MKYLLLFSILGIIVLSDFKDLQCTPNPVKTDHQLPEPKNIIYVVAHRGAHNGIPENSLAAYKKAIDIGCDFVEIDIRTTKDGRFVSVHNSTVNEYTDDAIGKVKEMTLTELRSLDIGSKTGAEWKNTRIPTFEEILQLCKGKCGIYLDLKDAPISELVKLIKKYEMEQYILWYIPASDNEEINELEKSCPDCLLMADPGPEKNISNVINSFRAPVLATDMDVLSEEFVKTAHRNGSIVIVDEKDSTEDCWKQILGWKTDGIQTDRPEELISFLKSRKHQLIK